MKHIMYERYLHLNRHGELSDAQRRELENHLETCPSCVAKRQQIEELEKEMGALRSSVQVLPDGEALTERILEAVSSMETKEVKPSPTGYLDRILLQLFAPQKLRYAYAALSLLLLLVLTGQGLDTLWQVRQMEQKMATGPGQSLSTGGQIVIQHEELPGLLTTLDDTVLEQGAALGIRLQEGRIYVRSSLFERWGQRLRSGDRNRILRLYGLRQQSPSQRKLQEFITNINFRSWGRAITLRPGR